MQPDYQERIAQVRKTLARKRLDAFLVTGSENRRYLSGFSARDTHPSETSGFLLISANRLFLLTDSRYELEAREEAPGFEVVVVKRGYKRAIAGLTRRYRMRRFGIESSHLLVSTYESLDNIPDLKLISTKDTVEKMRAIKTAPEISEIEKSVHLNERVFAEIMRVLRPGITEKEAAWEIERVARSLGADDLSFESIVASGPNAAKPHAVPTDRKIGGGEPIIIDMGMRLNGYCSDMTRTVFLGSPPPELAEIYRIVREAQVAAIEALKAEIKGVDADRSAREIIKSAGYGDAFGHALGHGVGLAVHEAPRLGPLSRDRLKPGMVVTVEPGIYLPGRGGVRLEDMVVIEEESCRNLNRDQTFYSFS
ncbi:MAG: aminopeptidase P family protein [Pseudomonadota bacterium]